jgi:hypothetical protein
MPREYWPYRRRWQYLTKLVVAVWLAAIAVLCLGGIARAIASEWRTHVSTLEPTAQNTASYVDHARTYFVPPSVARWHDRLAVIQGVGAVVAVALLPAIWFLKKRSEGSRAASPAAGVQDAWKTQQVRAATEGAAKERSRRYGCSR